VVDSSATHLFLTGGEEEMMKTDGIPKYRKFNGKRFTRTYTRDTKRAATKEVADLHASGMLGRVVKYGNKYVVYAR
jgi:hypothetical protein